METMNKQNQDQHRRNRQQPQQQHEPQKCPRCDSTNTKFCYYNNYSLSQPRYFCKTCRRYWTQGGTLRNVPVGGGCRKGKRAKTAASSSLSSSSSSASSSSSLPPFPLVPPSSDNNPLAASQYNYLSAATSGYLSSSFAAIQTSFTQPHHELLGVSSSFSSASALASSPMSLLQGFADISNSLGTGQHGQFYMSSNLSDREISLINQPGGTARPPINNGPVFSSSQQDHWPPQSFNNMISTSSSETAVWNISTGSARASNTSTSGPSLVPNHGRWPDLPRSYGSPPP